MATPRLSAGILVLLFSAAVSQPVAAQLRAPELAQRPHGSFATDCVAALVPTRSCFREMDAARRERSKARAPDYRYEGLAIGAGVGVVVGLLMGFAVCSQSDVTCGQLVPLTTLGMGAAVGFVGLMVGGLFDKPAEASAADSASH